MYQINYNQPVHVHFIGIGGISMSGLAAVLLKRSFPISGSDAKESPLTQWLTGLGAVISYPQSAANITDDIDVVVYTAAIHPDNPEFAAVQAKNIPMLSRAQLLGELMRNYEMPIAVSGTHGKTTTTSMLSHILMEADLDPTISVGGILPSIGGNVRIGHSQNFLTEACEYTNSFLELFPKIGIILNIDADHLDFFKDLEDIRHSFRLFAKRLPEDGILILNEEIPRREELTGELNCRIVTYGVQSKAMAACPGAGAASDADVCGAAVSGAASGAADSGAAVSGASSGAAGSGAAVSNGQTSYHAVNVSYDELGCGSFDLQKGPDIIGHFSLSVPGAHNVSNAVAALAAGDLLGISAQDMAAGLLSFRGTDRRFQKKGEIGGVTIIDDYAHHPTEIKATLRAARKYTKGTVWCVFQPHTYTRTKALMEEFTEALTLADKVVLADIYAARETDTLGISSDNLREKLEALGREAWYFPTFDEIETFLLESCTPGDLVITMGAGDVVKIGESLLGL